TAGRRRRSGGTVTATDALAGTVTVVLNGSRRSPVIVPLNVVVCGAPVLLRSTAFTVRVDVLRSAALSCTTWASRTETAPSTASSGANCSPVQPSGAGGFQSTMFS